jgi:hypothetical protein
MDLLELGDESICHRHDMSDLLPQSIRMCCMVVVSLAIEIGLAHESLRLKSPESLIDHRSMILGASYEICYPLIG